MQWNVLVLVYANMPSFNRKATWTWHLKIMAWTWHWLCFRYTYTWIIFIAIILYQSDSQVAWLVRKVEYLIIIDKLIKLSPVAWSSSHIIITNMTTISVVNVSRPASSTYKAIIVSKTLYFVLINDVQCSYLCFILFGKLKNQWFVLLETFSIHKCFIESVLPWAPYKY